MSSALYSIDILRLAAATAEWPRLAAPGASAERRSTTCGSRMVVDLSLSGDGRVVGYGHDVHACALGQAAATLFARHAVGRSAADLELIVRELAHWLAETGSPPPDWPGISVLEPARSHPARHSAIRLPFETAAAAARQIGA